MEVHRDAAVGFSRAAAEYERVRPSYPAAAVDHLARELDLRPGRIVLDLGAGTGKLSRLVAARGAEVVAVEPIEEMRAQLERAVPAVRAVAGTAEAIPLGAASVDAVVAGQAFHWFDPTRALPEIHRVLRTGCGVALLWNIWDTDASPALARIDALVESRRPPTPSRDRGESQAARLFVDSGLFTPLEERWFPYPLAMTHADLVARVATISFVAALHDDERAALLDEVRKILAGAPEPVAAGYRTAVYVGRRRDA